MTVQSGNAGNGWLKWLATAMSGLLVAGTVGIVAMYAQVSASCKQLEMESRRIDRLEQSFDKIEGRLTTVDGRLTNIEGALMVGGAKRGITEAR